MTLLLQTSPATVSTPVTLEGLIILLGAACVPLIVPTGKALIALLETLTQGRQQRLKIIEQLRKQQVEDRKFFTTQVQTAQARADQAYALSDTIRTELEQEREKRRLLAEEVARLTEQLELAKQEASRMREAANALEATRQQEREQLQGEVRAREVLNEQLRRDLEATKGELVLLQDKIKALEKKTDELPPLSADPTNDKPTPED